MENICGVTDFCAKRLSSAGLTRRVPRSMWCLPKREGLITKLPMAAAGVSMTLWRILSACSRCSPPRIFTRAPLHLATFQHQLADYPAHTLHETIPHFHDTPKRFADFQRAVVEDRMGRVAQVQPRDRVCPRPRSRLSM